MIESPEPLVAIITLNWNRCADTLAFLESCARLTYPRTQLIVVDNASTDGSVKAITRHFPQVTHLVNERNLGFAGGMNVGLRHALAQGGDYVFVANNDTILAADMLDHLVCQAQAHAADLATPAIYYAADPDRLWSLGGWRRRGLLEVRQCSDDPRAVIAREPFAVDFVTGCGMLARRSCLESIGLFDERFFMYYEDLDFSLRARAAGCRMLAVPTAKMWHKVAVSSGGSDSPNERYHMARSSVQLFRKHVHGWRWLVVAPYRAGSAMRTSWRLLTRGRRDAFRAYWRGLWDGMWC